MLFAKIKMIVDQKLATSPKRGGVPHCRTDPVTRYPKSNKRERYRKKIENKFHNQANDLKHFTAHTLEGVTL